MQWNIKTPYDGDHKRVKKFAFFPTMVENTPFWSGKCIIWLEYYHATYQYKVYSWGRGWYIRKKEIYV